MADLRDAAMAEVQWKQADDAAKEQAYIDGLVARARELLRPIFTDHTGKLVLDPVSKTQVAYMDLEAGLIILRTTDGSNLLFATSTLSNSVHAALPNDTGTQWTRGVPINSLYELGAAIQRGEI